MEYQNLEQHEKNLFDAVEELFIYSDKKTINRIMDIFNKKYGVKKR